MNAHARRSSLAHDGGTPVRTRPLPVAYDASGRWFGDEELAHLRDVLTRGALARWGGTKVDEFERRWADATSRRHAIAVSSGTAALHTALHALDLVPGTEVITSPITDMGTIASILAANLIPRFADVDLETGMITAESVEACFGPRTGAILTVHLFGRTGDVERLATTAAQRGVPLVEDASQAHFSRRGDRTAGGFGSIGAFSLQQSKVVSCGEGGIVVTDDDALADRMRLFQNKGWHRGRQGPTAYEFSGVNYRMGELAGAVALGQLAKAERIIAQRRRTHALLCDLLRRIPAITLPREASNEAASWWAFAFLLPSSVDATLQAKVATYLAAEGVPFSAGYVAPHPIGDFAAIADRRSFRDNALPWSLLDADAGIPAIPVAREVQRRMLMTNWNEGIDDADCHDIAEAIEKVLVGLEVVS